MATEERRLTFDNASYRATLTSGISGLKSELTEPIYLYEGMVFVHHLQALPTRTDASAKIIKKMRCGFCYPKPKKTRRIASYCEKCYNCFCQDCIDKGRDKLFTCSASGRFTAHQPLFKRMKNIQMQPFAGNLGITNARLDQFISPNQADQIPGLIVLCVEYLDNAVNSEDIPLIKTEDLYKKSGKAKDKEAVLGQLTKITSCGAWRSSNPFEIQCQGRTRPVPPETITDIIKTFFGQICHEDKLFTSEDMQLLEECLPEDWPLDPAPANTFIELGKRIMYEIQPKHHQCVAQTLRYMLHHFYNLTANHPENKMDAYRIAEAASSVFCNIADGLTPRELRPAVQRRLEIIKILIENGENLYGKKEDYGEMKIKPDEDED